MQSVADFYTKRNVELLKQWQELINNGIKTRAAAKTISENNEGISEGLIIAIVYSKEYPYAAEAWAIIHKEQAEIAEKTKKRDAKNATVGETATA